MAMLANKNYGDAVAREARREFRRQAAMYHPDVAGGDVDSFQRAAAEYEAKRQKLAALQASKLHKELAVVACAAMAALWVVMSTDAMMSSVVVIAAVVLFTDLPEVDKESVVRSHLPASAPSLVERLNIFKHLSWG